MDIPFKDEKERKIKRKYPKLKNSKIEINYSLKKWSLKQKFEELPQSNSFRKGLQILITKTPSNSPENNVSYLEKETQSPILGDKNNSLTTTLFSSTNAIHQETN